MFMSWDTVLAFWFENNAFIIQVVLILILITAGFLAFTGFTGKAASAEGSDGAGLGSSEQIQQLELTLRKVIEQTGAAGLQLGGGADVKVETKVVEGLEVDGKVISAQDFQTLQETIAQQKGEIEKLQEAAAQGGAGDGGGGSSVDASDYLAKIADLEARLAEYEIIEDDIADLSLFKEENARLKDELAAMKSGGGGAAPAAESDETEVEEAPAPEAPTVAGDDGAEQESEDLVAEFAAAVGQEPEAEAKADEPEPAAAAPAISFEDAPLEEEGVADAPVVEEAPVEEAVQVEPPKEADIPEDLVAEIDPNAGAEIPADPVAETVEPADESPEEVAAAPTEEPPADEPAAATDSSTEDEFAEDVLAEFAAAISDDSGGASVDVDTEAMMKEAQELSGAEGDGADSLEDEEPDMDKMAAEAEALDDDKA